MKQFSNIKNKKIAILAILFFLFSFANSVFALEVDYPTIAGQSPGGLLITYIRYLFVFLVSATGFIAVLVLAIGSVEYMSSAGDVSKIKSARSKIVSSSIGILILLSSYIILYTINPNLISLEEPTIAQLASQPLPETPISTVPTADLLTRIKILAEDTEQVPDIIYNSSLLISQITDKCDCKNTKAMCACEKNLVCPQTPWYTEYVHMSRIYKKSEGNELKVGDIISKGDVIGEVGETGTDTGFHLHFGVGVTTNNTVSTIDIASKISAPGRIRGNWSDDANVPPPPSITQPDLDYIYKTLISPLEYDQCVWYEIKNSYAHTGDEYWAQDWKCLFDDLLNISQVDLTASAKVHVMSGNLNNIADGSLGEVKSIVEKIDTDKGGVVIKHFCPDRPTVDIKANSSDGPITVPGSSSVNLTWTSTNAETCTASGSWLGEKPLSGTETTRSLNLILSPTGERVFSLTCTGYGGTTTDSVTINLSIGFETKRIKSLASIESLADITCPYGQTHYFYNNYQSEGCCDNQCVWFCWGNKESLCGPNGNQRCCPVGKTCMDNGAGVTSCCDNASACGTTEGYKVCCSPSTPFCYQATFYDRWPNWTRYWSAGICCPADKTNVCFNSHTPAKGTACCSQSDYCVETATNFTCCNRTTSITCGDVGSQICCTDPDGNATSGMGATDVSCGGTNTNPTCVVQNNFVCNAGETMCGTVKGHQACCRTGETCTPYTFFDANKGFNISKGFCCPSDRTKVNSEPNSNQPPACCKSSPYNLQEEGIKTTTGFGCCFVNNSGFSIYNAPSKIFGAPGFQICCTDPDGNANDYAGATSVIDTGTWNNPRCTVIPNSPPFSCVGGKTMCGTIPGEPTCCNTSSEQCITTGSTGSIYSPTKGYCCPLGSSYCLDAGKGKPLVCCPPNTSNYCLVTPNNDNACCNRQTSRICPYYLWGVFMGATCCPGLSGNPNTVICTGTVNNPVCATSILPEVTPPPPDPNCRRYDIASTSGLFFPGGYPQTITKLLSYIDLCCDWAHHESACINYKNPSYSFCCLENQKCVNTQSGANCSCPSDHIVCGSPELGNQVCCRTNQFCGGSPSQAICLDQPPPIVPTPTISCSPSQRACSDINYYFSDYYYGPNNLRYYLPMSETQTCCNSGESCYLEDKSGNPLSPEQLNYNLYFLPNSIGKCCPSNKHLYIKTFNGPYIASGYYGACCDNNVDIIVNNGVPSCCQPGEKACGDTVASEPFPSYSYLGKIYANGACCKSNEKCVAKKCQPIPTASTYCESPSPVPLESTYPKPCSCSPSPSPSPEVSPVNLKCADQTCFAGEKYHPCGETGFKELLYWQSKVISKKDVLIYYKNRLKAEKKDLKTDVEKYVKPTLEWFNREIARQYDQLSASNSPIPKATTEKQIAFLKERMGWLEEEQKYKYDLLRKMDKAEERLNQFEFVSNRISQLPDFCLSNVKSACNSVCSKGDGYFGCHDAFAGCQPLYCQGGNPCPAKEINEETQKLKELGSYIKSNYDDIIYIILSIKKERVPRITF